MREMTSWTPGMSFAALISTAPMSYVRALLGEHLCRLLDLLDGGQAADDRLRAVAVAVTDVEVLLAEPDLRADLLSRLPAGKVMELANRLEMPDGVESASYLTALRWTTQQRQQALEFFGVDAAASPAPTAPTRRVRDTSYGLFAHQRRAASRVRDLLDIAPRRVMLHLPTGVGKTRTAMNLICDHLRAHEPTVVVWLARGRELLEQAATEFERAWGYLGNRSLPVVRLWADSSADAADINDGVVVMGLDKAASLDRTAPHALARLSGHCRLVVFDEAHQAIAPTYQQVVDTLTVHPETKLLGLTATPGRTWSDIAADERLAEFFDRQKVTLEIEGHRNPVTALIEQGYLARPQFRTVSSAPGVELSDADRAALTNAFDLPVGIVHQLADDEQWNLQIVRTALDLVNRHHRILVFASSVRHCRMLASVLSALGIDAAYVTGDSSIAQRDRAINRFLRRGTKPMVLCNFGVLTTGFDAPAASAVVIARLTQSLVLYSQMVGRVLRGPRAGGTETCEIVTVVNPALPGFGDVAEAFTNWEDVWTSP